MCVGDSLCYLENGAIKDYLDQPSVRELLGVESPSNFSACSNTVGRNFYAHMDKYAVPTQFYVANLLDRGVRVLIYAGTYDWQCNWVANKLWVEALEWTGHAAFSAEECKNWSIEGDDGSSIDVGITKSAGPLTFASIWGAGHMISVSLYISVWLIILIKIFFSTSPMISLLNHWQWFLAGFLGNHYKAIFS